MVSKRMPPLNALRAFEATARLLSVKNAAGELRVTPGAVSQMLKGLEASLGVKLFKRVNRGIFLTDIGELYLPPVRNAFRQIADATRRIEASAESGVLTVSMTASFAAAWLVPRLSRFHTAHPDIDLRVVTSEALADFLRDGVDVAVRHGLGNYAGLRSDRIFTVELVPVAAPALVAEHGDPCGAASLVQWPHLHDAERQDWYLWFRAQGIDNIDPPRGSSFDDIGLLLRAAIAGQGAALLPAAMVTPDLTEGRLVRLSDIVWPEAFAYYLVSPQTSTEPTKVVAFRDWIMGEVRQLHGSQP
jgi:LysR family transcriptional regulator, glycine cleavage system transcriptional activator